MSIFANSNKKLLVVDDNEMNRAMLKSLLEETYEVTEAEDGECAIDILSRDSVFIQAVLLDVNMPKVDGYGVLDYMKNSGIIDYVPVIMISADNNSESLSRAYDMGASEYFTKPFDIKIIKSRIRSVIALYERNFLDSVTGYMSRKGFCFHADSFLAHPSVNRADYAVLYFNIEKFNLVNNIMGIDAGDELLKQFADLIVESSLQPVYLGRVSDDRFVCLVHKDNIDLNYLAEGIRFNFKKEGREIKLSSRCGIYENTDYVLTVPEMIECSNLALKMISQEQNCHYKKFSDELQMKYKEHNELIADFETAMKRGDFKVYYQPVVDASTGNITSAEALVRWIHPVKGMISPAVFIPVIEHSGKVSAIDRFVFEHVVEYQQGRLDRGEKVIPVSVNISWVDLYDVAMMEMLERSFQLSCVRQEYVRIEITESSYATITDERHDMLTTVRNAGIKIMIDDFGSGYSSYGSLNNYSFDFLKLDMSFTKQIEKNQKTKVIIKGMIDMSHEIGIPVVAEGVENLSQAEFLDDNGCDYIQGYYYYKPMPEEEFSQLIK